MDSSKLYRRSTLSPMAILFLGLMAATSLLSAQEPLPPIQFNVPYRCADGKEYVIHRCQTYPKGEVCYYSIGHNGQVDTEVYNVRSQLTGFMKACPAQSATRPAQNAAEPAAGQALDPAYLAGLPAVDKVKQGIQGNSSTDTLARQVAVLTYLPQLVVRMQNRPGRRYGSFTPDEQRLMGAYSLAAYELLQSYVKSHTPEEGKAFSQLEGRYEMNSELLDRMYRLCTPAFVAEYWKNDAAAMARYQAHVEQERRDNGNARPFEESPQGQGQAQGQTPFVRNDPGTLAARRCMELGGNELECVGKGFTTGLLDMTGIDLSALRGPAKVGLRMTGLYKGAGDFRLVFGDDTAGIGGCGKLVEEGHAYTITKKGNQLLIEVANQPKSFVVALGPDGKLTGPGPTDIAGKVIVGYHRYWVEKRRVSDNTIIPGSGHEEQEPIYAPKTERCTIGVLPPAGSTSSAGSALVAVLKIVSGQQSDEEAGREAEKNATPPGPRMLGQYSGQGGLRAEFNTDTVILDCGEAHVEQRYTVENTVNQVLVTVKNGATPFTVALQPDGTLAGSGTVDVAGRVVTGSNANGIAYAPRNARCALGTLAAKGSAAGPAAAYASPGPANSPAAPAPAAPPAGNAVLSVAAGLAAQAGGASPLAGQGVLLLKDSLETALAKGGFQPPAGLSPIQGWISACQNRAPDCQKAAIAIGADAAAARKADANGKVEFPGVPAGTYFVVSAAPLSNQVVRWNLKVDLKPGANSVTLDQRNAMPRQ